MKITCQSCQAKYMIADDKVVGKTVKIKCKKCGATVVVHGNEGDAGPAMAPAPTTHDDEDGGATRVLAEGQAPPPGAFDEWTVNVTDDDQRTLSTQQLVDEYMKGVVSNDSYVWKDGMADWLPFSSVPELMSMVQKSAGAPRPAAGMPAAAPAAAAAPGPSLGLGGTVMMNEAPKVAASPAAAKRARNAPAIDLFGTNNEMPSALPNASAGMSAASANAQAEKLTGERNENSVLFSLSALTAAENAARAQGPSGNRADDAFNARPSAPTKKDGGRAGLDDIMNLGGGMSAAPLLAPPPLLAPVVEPPPPPQPIAPVVSAMPASVRPMPMAPAAFAPKKSPVGLVLGIVGALAVIGGVLVFLLMRSKPAPTATNEAATSTAAATAPSSTPSSTPTETAAATSPPADTSQASAEPSSTPSTTPSATAAAGHTPTTGPIAANEKKEDKKNESKTPEPAKTADPPPAAKTADPAPAAGSGREFDRSAAMSALSAAAGAARGCKKPDGPTGSGRVKIIFAPSGNVTSATVEGGPFAGTSVGGCVASAFRGAHVPPFDGSAVAVSKSFSIN